MGWQGSNKGEEVRRAALSEKKPVKRNEIFMLNYIFISVIPVLELFAIIRDGKFQ